MSARYDDLTKEELIRLLEARDRRDATRFGLVWEANEIERDKALNGDFVALDFDETLSCGEAPYKNLIIEGDNFDALRHLRMCYAGKVKCIYIDPPYNTGNKDFVYNDRFVDKEDGWRHSKWCEFMFQRLTLAKDLLTQDGVIFVSIDDNEVASLRLLMDRIFGEGNFLANIIWQKRTSPDARLNLGPAHDFIIVFAKSIIDLKPTLNKIPLSIERTNAFKNIDNDARGAWASVDMTGQTGHATKEQFFEIKSPSGMVLRPPSGRCWAFSKSTVEKLIADKRVWFGKDGKSRPRLKHFLSEREGGMAWSWWTNTEVGHNQEATKELAVIMQKSEAFTNPKPVRLIDRILRIATNPGDLILDFFAGSGTTGHAVLKLNAEDQGNRRFILVSSTEATEDEPEKNLCRDVCAERVRRVIRGYADIPPLGGDFAYLRCRRIPTGQMIEIDHAQVWTALQMMHCESITPFVQADFLLSREYDFALVYVPRFSKKIIASLRKAVKEVASVIVYSWQPETLRQALRSSSVQHEAIPESLARRFGIR